MCSTRSGRPASGLAGSSSAAVAQAEEEVSEPRYTVYRRPYGWLAKNELGSNLLWAVSH